MRAEKPARAGLWDFELRRERSTTKGTLAALSRDDAWAELVATEDFSDVLQATVERREDEKQRSRSDV